MLFLEVGCPDDDGVGVIDGSRCGAIYRRRQEVRCQRIVQSCVAAGCNVRGRDLTDELNEKTRETMVKGRFGLQGAVERGKLTQEQVDAALARLSFTTEVEELRDADLIIEAVPEDLDMKRKVFAELDGVIKPAAVFVSNTSGFSIADLSQAVSRKDRFAGMHWCSPAFVVTLIGVIHGPAPSADPP